MRFKRHVQKDLCHNGCDCEDEEGGQAVHGPSWDGLRWVAGAGGDDIEDFGRVGSADAEVGLFRDHLCQGLVDSRPLLWRFFLGGLVQDSKSLGLVDAIREEIQNDEVQRDIEGQRWAAPAVKADQDAVGVAVQQLHHVCRIPDIEYREVEMDARGSRNPDSPVADPPSGVGVREVRRVDHSCHGGVVPTAGAHESVKEDNPAVPTAGLRVVPEADTIALGAGCLPVLPVVRIIPTEACVA